MKSLFASKYTLVHAIVRGDDGMPKEEPQAKDTMPPFARPLPLAPHDFCESYDFESESTLCSEHHAVMTIMNSITGHMCTRIR